MVRTSMQCATRNITSDNNFTCYDTKSKTNTAAAAAAAAGNAAPLVFFFFFFTFLTVLLFFFLVTDETALTAGSPSDSTWHFTPEAQSHYDHTALYLLIFYQTTFVLVSSTKLTGMEGACKNNNVHWTSHMMTMKLTGINSLVCNTLFHLWQPQIPTVTVQN